MSKFTTTSPQAGPSDAMNMATPYTPFSPYKSKSGSIRSAREYIPSISTSDSTGLASPAISASATYSSVTPGGGASGGAGNGPGSGGARGNHLYSHHLSVSIGSRSELVKSPDGGSIQLAPEAPHILSPKKMLISDSTTISPIFRSDVRQEWIDAMFGKDFFPKSTNGDGGVYTAADYTPPRQGVGLAGIPSYLSYTAKIPPAKEEADAGNKVGVTLSRIPIGVYVRTVDIESEAYAAGVVPGSVLVEINGMGVLGEPSHKLLERMWKFEGHFDEFIDGDHEGGVGINGMNGGGIGGVGGEYKNKYNREKELGDGGKFTGSDRSIVALKLIKDGVLYSTVFVTGSAFGISWAPCGNFALIQRTYAMAQRSGVRRGCIVAAVNDKSLREMNHLDTAMYLKDQFDSGNAIRVVCVFTPAASRTGFHERKGSTRTPRKVNEVRTIDGVRIRKVSAAVKKNNNNKEKPTEYGVGSFFTCGTGINYQPNSADTSLSDVDVLTEIANRVAAGEIAAPSGYGRGISMRRGENNPLLFSKLVSEYMCDTNSIQQESPQKNIVLKLNGSSTFPKFSWYDLFPSWDPLESLVFCLRMHSVDYSEESFYDIGGLIGAGSNKSALLSSKNDVGDKIPLHSKEANTKLIGAIGSIQDCNAFHSYLLQIVAFISSRELFDRILAELIVANTSQIDSLTGSKKKEFVKSLSAEAKEKTEAVYEEIVPVIVDIAIRDDSLCQSFHFLLRSFSSTIFKKKPNADDDNAVFAPIKMLTSAHILLRNRLLDRDANAVAPDLSYESLATSSDQQGVSCSRDSIDVSSAEESKDRYQKGESGRKGGKGKRFGKIFRRGSKKGSKDSNSKNGETNESFPSPDDTDDTKTNGPRKKMTFIPNSILRKAADQNPQDNGSDVDSLIADIPSTALLFENMGWFLSNIDQLCGNIEKALLKSFSQKLTEWTLQPWSASKDRALADGTADMRNGLHVINLSGRSRANEQNSKKWAPVINPVNSSEFLVSVIPEESYILPSAHFPLLLAFNACTRTDIDNAQLPSESKRDGVDTLYQTRITINVIRGNDNKSNEDDERTGFAYVVHAAVGSDIKQTGKSTLDPYYESSTHRWHENNTLEFESRSSTGYPGAVVLRLSSVAYDNKGTHQNILNDESGATEVGFCFLELGKMWEKGSPRKGSFQVKILNYDSQPDFDQQGYLDDSFKVVAKNLTIELQVATAAFPFHDRKRVDKSSLRKRMLLYKHDEDMRQEMLATQFVDICDKILKASGLDLQIKKYKCIPVGEKKGFIEWVPGAFSLSELCKPMGMRATNDSNFDSSSGVDNDKSDSAFIRTGGWCEFESLRSLRQNRRTVNKHGIGISGNNPIQDFFRSHAYDPRGPYLIKKEVMDNFVKSCAGYSVITYILGVGDRHTDNLLLHPQGYFLHCDYSFILGQDPKTYLPMRITEHMVNGMGGKDSDNFAMFLSLAGAAFVTLRRHPSVRTLLSVVRMMIDSEIPDIIINQSPDDALQSMHERFRLDLNDDEAVSYLEENIERSISSKMWVAVDAIHSLGKRF